MNKNKYNDNYIFFNDIFDLVDLIDNSNKSTCVVTSGREADGLFNEFVFALDYNNGYVSYEDFELSLNDTYVVIINDKEISFKKYEPEDDLTFIDEIYINADEVKQKVYKEIVKNNDCILYVYDDEVNVEKFNIEDSNDYDCFKTSGFNFSDKDNFASISITANNDKWLNELYSVIAEVITNEKFFLKEL